MKTPDEIKKGLYHCAHDPDCKGCPYDYDCFMDEDSSAIANDTLEYIQQFEAAQPKWISVKERLPDEPGEVLAYMHGIICMAWYSNRCFETQSGIVFYIFEDTITHWMPLPEPPEEVNHD